MFTGVPTPGYYFLITLLFRRLRAAAISFAFDGKMFLSITLCIVLARLSNQFESFKIYWPPYINIYGASVRAVCT